MWSSALQCAAVAIVVFSMESDSASQVQYVVEWCSVVQCGAVWCRVVQCDTV